MAVKISLTKEDVEAIESRAGAESANEEEQRLLSFLANKYRSEEAVALRNNDDDPVWIFNIWTYVFD